MGAVNWAEAKMVAIDVKARICSCASSLRADSDPKQVWSGAVYRSYPRCEIGTPDGGKTRYSPDSPVPGERWLRRVICTHEGIVDVLSEQDCAFLSASLSSKVSRFRLGRWAVGCLDSGFRATENQKTTVYLIDLSTVANFCCHSSLECANNLMVTAVSCGVPHSTVHGRARLRGTHPAPFAFRPTHRTHNLED